MECLHPVRRYIGVVIDILHIVQVFQHIDENGVAITVNDIVTADGIAFVQFNGTAKGRSGMTYDNEYVHLLRYRDGKICSITEFLDTNLLNKLLEQ